MAENYNLGTASGRILVDADTKGVKDAEKALDDVGKKGKNTQATLDKVAKGTAIAGAAIAAGLGLAVKSAADFEKGLSNIKAVTGANDKQMEATRKKALQLGKDTQFSAGEAAAAIEELAKAGIKLPDVLNGAADATVNLAAAGEVSMPEAATIASNAMNQFSLKAEDMVNVADKIAGAANASAIDVSDFGMSLSQVGAVANLAGLSFDDTAVAIAEMGNAGIKGSDAGTSLKTMLSNLQPATDKQAGMMKRLGIITKDGTNLFYDQQGQLKSLADIQGILFDKTSKLDKAHKQMALRTIFGSDAIRAAAVLSKEGAKGYDKMSTSMGKVKAADVAKTKMDNLAGSIEQMKGSLETLGIVLGTTLLPLIRSLVDHVTGLLNWFLNLDPGIQKAIVAFLAMAATALLVTASIIKIAKGIKAFQDAMKVLKGLESLSKLGGALFSPWTLAIIALIIIIVLLVKYHKQIWKVVKQVWGAIAGFFKKIWGDIVDFFKSIWGSISGFFSRLWNDITNIFNTVIAFITAHWKGFLTGLLTLMLGPFGLMVGLVIQHFNAIKSFLAKVWAIIKKIFQTYLSILLTIWDNTFGRMWRGLQRIWGLIMGFIEREVRGFKAILSSIGDVVGKVIGFFVRIYDGAKDKLGAIIHFVAGLGGKIANAARGMWDGISDAFKTVINAIIGMWNGFVGHLKFGGWDPPGPGPKVPGFDLGSHLMIDPIGLATGGILLHPTLAMLAEKEPEAVIPLGKLADMISDGVVAASAMVHGGGSSNATTNNRHLTIVNNYPEPETSSENLPRTIHNLEFVGAL